MKTKYNLIALLLIFSITSCKKNEIAFKEFEFADKPEAITCKSVNSKLYNEAFYSFENDILNFYSKENKSLLTAYSQFTRLAINNRANYRGIVSEHTLKIFDALKEDSELWDLNNTKSHLNYNSDLVDCISQNIANPDLKTTFNALLSTNSMSPRLFGAPLASSYSLALNDKYLAAYVAFDLFYAKLFDIDFTQPIIEKSKVDFNITK